MSYTTGNAAPPPTASDIPSLKRLANPFSGLQPGRIVNYVLASGGIRPMLVVVAWTLGPTMEDPTRQLSATGVVNGIVFRDGTNDTGEFGAEPAPVEFSIPNGEGEPTKVSLPPGVRLAEWATSVQFDPRMKPGTWHWPAKADPLPVLNLIAISLRVKAIEDRLKHHGIEIPDEDDPAAGSGSERYGASRPDFVSGEDLGDVASTTARGTDVFTQPPAGEPVKHPNTPDRPKTATEDNKAEGTSA